MQTPPTAIRSIRETFVMLDFDLAQRLGVTTRQLNQTVRRNRSRFPAEFYFQLTREEFAKLTMDPNNISPRLHHLRYSPFAFTQHGATMAAALIKTKAAAAYSVALLRSRVG